MRFKQNLIRLFFSIAVFAICLLFVPNIYINNVFIFIICAMFIVLLDYLVSTITNIHDYPLGRGIIGFFSATIIIYSTQFFITGFYINFFAAIICAAIYSLVDYFLPNR